MTILLGIFAATRGLVRALPGDPLETLIAESGTSIPPQILREEFNLDKPFFAALISDLKKASVGDFGLSLLTRQPVAEVVAKRFLNTLALSLLALIIGLTVSLLLGLSAAAKPSGLADTICTVYGGIAAALPTPWLGPIIILTFAVIIPIFPVGGNIIPPALTLALGFSGVWARLIRERVRDTLMTGSATGARARGVPEWKVILKYGFAPASAGLAAYLGTRFGGLLAGAFVTEVIFNWSGLGSLLVESVLQRDYMMVEGATFVAAGACLMGTWAGDLAQNFINPVRQTK
ncbi:MAG: ABC transporter permease [Bdellovibrionota bacterium]